MSTRVYKYRDEEFLVTDSEKERFIEVRLPGFDGVRRISINLKNPERGKYVYGSFHGQQLSRNQPDQAFDAACQGLLAEREQQQRKADFDHKEAADELKRFVETLDEGR